MYMDTGKMKCPAWWQHRNEILNIIAISHIKCGVYDDKSGYCTDVEVYLKIFGIPQTSSTVSYYHSDASCKTHGTCRAWLRKPRVNLPSISRIFTLPSSKSSKLLLELVCWCCMCVLCWLVIWAALGLVVRAALVHVWGPNRWDLRGKPEIIFKIVIKAQTVIQYTWDACQIKLRMQYYL